MIRQDGSSASVRIDCHVHTADSYDSAATVDEILRHAARVDIDGLVVTDHDRIERSLRVAENAADFGLIGIPGVEVSTADGHLLAIGVKRRPEPGRPLTRTVENIRNSGGIAVVPHPFQWSRHGARADAIDDCDGVEVFNAHSLTGIRNRQADRFARKYDYPRFGGSDAHVPSLIGRGVTLVDLTAEPITPTGVVEAMRAGRTRAAGYRTSVRWYLGKWAYNARFKSPKLPKF